MKRLICGLLLWLPALPALAQESRPITEEVAAAVEVFYNRPGTIRLNGESRVPAGAEVAGDVATLGGPLVVGGTIRGDVVVINGDLRLEPGARVTGRATVVGGAVRGATEAVLGGSIVYPEGLRFRREGDRLTSVGPAGGTWLGPGWATRFGRAAFTLVVDGSYNRVEGLPVAFGPRVELGRSNPTVVDARLIYRTRSGLRIHPDEFGHDLRLEQYLGGHRSTRIGLGLHRVIDPIEGRGLTDTENSLATFILHRDYRDHYTRHGWRAYLVYGGRTIPFSVGLEYRDEEHGSARAGTPWSLLDNDEEWRAQPQAAEGELRTLRGWLIWDSRNDRHDPATGWLVEVETEQGLEGALRLRTGTDLEPGATRAFGAEYTSLSVDARRYFRLGPRTRVAFRGIAAGSPDDGPLPPQRQHVLGGEGSLPGFDRFAFDCGARAVPTLDDFLPYYGCDRSVLLQAEARFAFTSGDGFSVGRWLGLDFELLTTPELVLFADAGRAWIEPEALGDRDRAGPGALRYDAGAGLRLGQLGFYLAAPLSGGGEGPNFFVRLGPRL